jgi:hypothetical protein
MVASGYFRCFFVVSRFIWFFFSKVDNFSAKSGFYGIIKLKLISLFEIKKSLAFGRE